jgi:hypothetical protein
MIATKETLNEPPVAEACFSIIPNRRNKQWDRNYNMSRTYVEADSVSFFFNQRGTGTAHTDVSGDHHFSHKLN